MQMAKDNQRRKPASPNCLLPYLLPAPIVAIAGIFHHPQPAKPVSEFIAPIHWQPYHLVFDNFRRLMVKKDYSTLLVSVNSAVIVSFGLSITLAVANIANQRLPGFAYRALLIWPYALSPAMPAWFGA
jgi:ABC-type sugar transport system permease subunit